MIKEIKRGKKAKVKKGTEVTCYTSDESFNKILKHDVRFIVDHVLCEGEDVIVRWHHQATDYETDIKNCELLHDESPQP